MDDKELLCKIGLRIKELRDEKKLSQQDLAARCNFEKSNMSRIEAGRTNLTIKTLNLIAKALSVKVSAIVDVE